ncbi:MAG: toxin-antitoxin system HicB family antitoxin [Gaiellales bacterium]
MELSPITEAIRADLAVAAELGDEAVRDAADRLGRALESSLRVRLLDALAQIAHELEGQLGTGTVELRLVGDSAELTVTREPAVETPKAAPEEAETARITLRLPESLKLRAESAAAAEGMSTNAWLVRAVGAAVGRQASGRVRVGQRLRGFADS